MNLLLKNFVTFALAAFYALIASCGHGLHSHGAHCDSLECNSICHQATECCSDCESSSDAKQSCHDHDHFAEIRKALQSETRSSTNEPTLAISADASFSLHDCAACQLLSQIEVGFAIAEPHAGAWLNANRPPLLNDSINVESTERSFDARGPPARG